MIERGCRNRAFAAFGAWYVYVPVRLMCAENWHDFEEPNLLQFLLDCFLEVSLETSSKTAKPVWEECLVCIEKYASIQITLEEMSQIVE